MKIYSLFAVLFCLYLLPQEIAADEDCAVINDRVWNCKIDDLKYKLNFKTSITIFNKRGDKYGRIFISENGHSKVKEINLRVKDESGQILFERKKDDFTRICGYGQFEVYTDDCYYDITVSAPSYPYTIEYDYVLDCKTLFFWSDARFQLDIPINHAAYILDVPIGFPFNYKAYDIEIEPTITNVENNRTSYRWELHNIPATEDIEDSPSGSNGSGRIRFAPHNFKFGNSSFNECSWFHIGNWFYTLAQDKYNLQTNRLQIKDSATALSILKKNYSKVVEKTRYVAVEIGIGGWEPYAASLTESRGYGDCKDMTTLLLSDFKSRGIEAYPALVLTKGRGKTDPNFPDFSFNHVIAVAVVGTDTVWMDPTCDNCPFGELSFSVQDINALVVKRDGSKLWKTSSNAASDNITSRITHWSINSDLYADLTCSLTVTGSYALALRNNLLTKSKVDEKKYIDRMFKGANKTYKINSYQISNLNNKEQPVEIIINGKTTKVIRKIGDLLYFRPTLICELTDLEKTEFDEREIPLDLYYPESTEDLIVVSWDSSLAIDSVALPKDVSLEFEAGKFQYYSSQDSLGVTIQTSRIYDSFVLPVEHFKSFSTYRKKMKNKLGKSLKLIQK